MGEDISSIQTIEAEAEKTLESARVRANEVLLKGKEEASRILSSDLPMDEVRAECEQIIRNAKEEAETIDEDSREKAAQIGVDADSKVAKIAERMASIVTGSSPR